MARYIAGKKLFTANKKFPLVLMLEPLHRCNLHCTGCGRIREYAGTLHQELTVNECLDAVRECNAPIVSICGGEPLIYKDIAELVDRILNDGRFIYLCTNGQLLEEKLGIFEQLAVSNRLVKKRLYWNVHLDGTAVVHDAITERQGSFDKALCGIAAAKQSGFRVYTNSTLYKQSTVDDLIHLAETLTARHIDGMMIAPGYGYDAVQQDKLQNAESFFLTRSETHRLFQEIRQRMRRFPLTATPVFSDYLCGERELPCAAWANPTRNIKGWRSPCYLIADTHYPSYQELLDKTDWTAIGFGKNVRCADCLMHCGYEPAAVLFGNRLRDLMRTAVWQMR
ncbi:hopanoid biosynthesis associated radical SAM protein HpnH [Planctomycetales bacterium]|nr:hopanoid biosynthesis associated radical SAM protein HpnH [Planctomycetales bacterium]